MARTVWTPAFVSCVLFIAALADRPASSQGPPPAGMSAPLAAGLVVGRVVDATTSRPIANAIVNISTGQGVPRELTVVGLTPAPPARRMLTDGDGRFVFRDLAEGLYIFNVTAPGYIGGAYGQRRPQSAAQPFVLGKDEQHGDVTIRLWKDATIVGTVTDELGDPVVGVFVGLLRQSRTNGRWPSTIYNSGRTDDRGVYRISGNLPGQYYVIVASSTQNVPMSVVDAFRGAIAAGGDTQNQFYQSIASSRALPPDWAGQQVGDAILQFVSPMSGPLPPAIRADGTIVAYPTTFYPGATSSARATPLVLAAGEERTGVDLQMRPVVMMRVSGTLTGPNGPQPHFGVRLVSTESDAVGGGDSPFEAAHTTTDASGRFLFLAVPPGQFTAKAVSVSRQGPGPASAAPASTLWAEASVSVGDVAVSDVRLHLREAASVSGRFEFEGEGPRPTPQALAAATISFVAADARATPCCPPTRVAPDGTFRTPGYLPGKYFPAWTNIAGWHMKAVTAGARDILRVPLTIENEPVADLVVTFTSAPSVIDGRVVDPKGAYDGTASVVIFPADYVAATADGINTRVVRLARPSPQTGAFNLMSVIPGDYLIAAAPDDALSTWQEAGVIRALAQFAARVTIAPGERKRIQLTRGQMR